MGGWWEDAWDQVTVWLSDQVTEWPSVQVNKWPCDQVTKWLSDWVTEWLSDQVTELLSDQVTEWLNVQMTKHQMNGWQEPSQTIDRMVYFYFQSGMTVSIWCWTGNSTTRERISERFLSMSTFGRCPRRGAWWSGPRVSSVQIILLCPVFEFDTEILDFKAVRSFIIV